MLSKNKSRERQIPYELIYIWNLKEEEEKKRRKHLPTPSLLDIQNRLLVCRGGEGKMDEGDQKVPNSYRVSQSWGCNVEDGDYG